jgi:hypothetical protein
VKALDMKIKKLIKIINYKCHEFNRKLIRTFAFSKCSLAEKKLVNEKTRKTGRHDIQQIDTQ